MGTSKKIEVTLCQWQLVRQDDNGNRHLLGTFPSEEEALAQMVRYERRGHKQTFWVELAEGENW